MVEMDERELLANSLKQYLEDLLESGLDELPFADAAVVETTVAETTVAETAAAETAAAETAAAETAAAEHERTERSSAGTDCLGVGNPQARLLFVMAGAGFAGASGELLAKIIQAMGFAPPDVFLLSFGAGSPGAAPPERDELMRRIAAVGPEAIVALGEQAARLLLQSGDPIGKLRGRFHDLQGTPLMPTLHPDEMEANPGLKREVWGEMQQVMRRLAQEADLLGGPVPARTRCRPDYAAPLRWQG